MPVDLLEIASGERLISPDEHGSVEASSGPVDERIVQKETVGRSRP